MMRERLCFTNRTGLGGCEGRRCQTAVAVMFGYVRLWSPICSAMLAYGRLWSDRSDTGKCKLLDAL